MIDIAEITFKQHLQYAREGYVDDAYHAIDWAIDLLHESKDIPEYLKNYLVEELAKLLIQDTQEYAFYLKVSGKGKQKNSEVRERNLEIANRVIRKKFWDDNGNERTKPLSDEDAIFETSESFEISDKTVGNAYYARIKNLK